MKWIVSFFFLSISLHAQHLKTEKAELIFPLQEEHAHGSTVVSLPNGDVLVAWFQGSGERKSDDVKIMGSRLKKGSPTWSVPFLMADTPHIPDCNPVLFLNHQGKLFLVWIAVQANQWEHSVLKLRTSENYSNDGPPVWNWQDNILLKPGDEFAAEVEKKLNELPSSGQGWSEYAPAYDDLIIQASKDPGKRAFGWMTRIKPLLLSEGKIVLPLYSDGFNMGLMAISEDDGQTWKPGLPMVGRGPIQPALAFRKDGTLVAFSRDSGHQPIRVHRSESSDKGQTWSPSSKTNIPTTASVELQVLKSGHWIFIGNDLDNSREKLSLYISEDEGKTWIRKYVLENKPGGYSYPALIQSENGDIHITYSYHPDKNKKSIKYIRIKPESLIR